MTSDKTELSTQSMTTAGVNTVVIDLRDMWGFCHGCQQVKPLAEIGLQMYQAGLVRKQPWCKSCR